MSWRGLLKVRTGTAGASMGNAMMATGLAMGVEFQVNSVTSGNQDQSASRGVVNGGFVVAWNIISATGSGQGVFAQRHAAEWTAQGAQFQVNRRRLRRRARLAPRAIRTAFRGVGRAELTCANVSILNGQQVGQEFLLNNLSGVSNLDPSWWFAFRPAIVAAADGSFVAVWQDQWPTYVHPYTVQAQRYKADDSLNGGLITVYNPGYSSNGNWSATPQVGLLSDGGFVAVWYDSSTNGLDGQRYDANGNAVNSVFQISSGTGDLSAERDGTGDRRVCGRLYRL